MATKVCRAHALALLLVIAGCSFTADFSRPLDGDDPPIYHVEPLPIHISPELESLIEDESWSGIGTRTFYVGNLFKRAFTGSPEADAKMYLLTHKMAASATHGLLATRFDMLYSVSVALDVAGRRNVLSAVGTGSSYYDSINSGQRAAESVVYDIYQQSRALVPTNSLPVSGD